MTKHIFFLQKQFVSVCLECSRIKSDIAKNKYMIEYTYWKIHFWNMLDMRGFDFSFLLLQTEGILREFVFNIDEVTDILL